MNAWATNALSESPNSEETVQKNQQISKKKKKKTKQLLFTTH